jgi:hypothetical protein
MTEENITLPDIPITDARLDMLTGLLSEPLHEEIYGSVGSKELIKMGKKKRELCIIASMIGVGFKLCLRASELGATFDVSRVLGDDNWLLYATQGEEPQDEDND